MPYVVMAYIVMPYVVLAYTVTALYSYGLRVGCGLGDEAKLGLGPYSYGPI